MFKALWRRWLVGARKIGQFQPFLILSLFYFVAIAPFALAVRCLVDPLGLRVAPSWLWLSRGEELTDAEFHEAAVLRSSV